MEGLAWPIAILLALSALVVAIGAAFVVVRQGPRPIELSAGTARTSELERRLVQMGHRLEVLEAEVDARAIPNDVQGSSPDAVRTAGAALSHLGLVRFDAFDDTGGGQSFALALLDEDGDGLILTSLHSRQSTRLYVKGVRRGVPDSPVSGEEVRAMQQAGVAPAV
jgi:hypothetical protein